MGLNQNGRRKGVLKMARKRMFTMKIVDSDAFLDMPLSTQCLYFHLNMRADDDGFVGNPKRIAKLIGSNDDDLKLLIAKRFVLLFEDGVIVIKHWRIHNTLSRDRYVETSYTDEKKELFLKDNGSYSLTDGIPIDDTKLIERSNRQTQNKCEIEVENRLEEKDTICQTDIQKVINEWNTLEEFGITPVKRMTPKREQAVKARIRQNHMDDILEAIENIRHSSFLQGQNKEGWMITFDWFLKPGNFAKVFEGNYLDKSGNKPQSYMEKIQNRVSEVDNWV
jgi:hypothetical protein